MNFTINRDTLLRKLKHIERGISNKTPQPILKGIKLDVYKDNIVITSSNTNISVQVSITENLEVIQEGSIVLPGKIFIDIVKKISNKEIKLTKVDSNSIHITSGKSNFTLNELEIEDYPIINFETMNDPIKIKSEDFKSLIKQTIFSAATQENRPILTGVNFIINNDTLKCVATDSYRLSEKTINIVNDKQYKFVLPAKSLEELNKILIDPRLDLSLYINSTDITIVYDNIHFKSRLLEGNYPETSRLIPTEFPIVIKFNKEELITAVEHASLLSTGEATSNIIKLNLRPDLIVELTSQNSEIGKVLEELHPVDKVKGNSIKISFSSKYMLDALKVINSSEVSLNLTGEIRPFTMTGEHDVLVTQLILPVRTE